MQGKYIKYCEFEPLSSKDISKKDFQLNCVPGEDPFDDGVVEGRAEEVAQQGHPAPRQLPPLGGVHGGGGGRIVVGEMMESVAGSFKAFQIAPYHGSSGCRGRIK